MSTVLVEFPIEEAEALLNDRVPFGSTPTAKAGWERLEKAVAIECGPSGNAESSPTVVEQVQVLIGQNLRLLTSYGAEKHGKLIRVSQYRTLVLEEGGARQPISLSLIAKIEPEAVAA